MSKNHSPSCASKRSLAGKTRALLVLAVVFMALRNLNALAWPVPMPQYEKYDVRVASQTDTDITFQATVLGHADQTVWLVGKQAPSEAWLDDYFERIALLENLRAGVERQALEDVAAAKKDAAQIMVHRAWIGAGIGAVIVMVVARWASGAARRPLMAGIAAAGLVGVGMEFLVLNRNRPMPPPVVLEGVVQSYEYDARHKLVVLPIQSGDKGDYLVVPLDVFRDAQGFAAARRSNGGLAGAAGDYVGRRIRVAGQPQRDAAGRRFLQVARRNQIELL